MKRLIFGLLLIAACTHGSPSEPDCYDVTVYMTLDTIAQDTLRTDSISYGCTEETRG